MNTTNGKHTLGNRLTYEVKVFSNSELHRWDKEFGCWIGTSGTMMKSVKHLRQRAANFRGEIFRHTPKGM